MASFLVCLEILGMKVYSSMGEVSLIADAVDMGDLFLAVAAILVSKMSLKSLLVVNTCSSV